MKSKTTVLKGETQKRDWHLIDLKGKTLGRACTEIAQLLMGKGKPDFSFHRDDGDYVVAINASGIKTTGRKLSQKVYYSYTNYAGGLKEFTLKQLLERNPNEVIMHGVKGMLPKNKLRDKRLTRLKVFAGNEHSYADKLKQNG